MSQRARRPVTALHCRSSSGRYGPERLLMEVIPALKDQGIETRLLALYRAPPGGPDVHPWIVEAEAEGVRASQIEDPSPLSVAVLRRLAHQVRRSGADILHTHDYRSNILGGLAARRADKSLPWVATVHLHTATSRRLRLYRALDLFLLRLADRVITVSRDQRRLLLRRGVDRQRLVLIPTAIDAAAFRSEAEDRLSVRKALDLPTDCPVVVFLGRLSVQKGVDHFLAAAERVGAARPDARFLIVGNGAQRPALERRATELGLDDVVSFLGYQAGAASLLGASDVVVLPSRSEGLPVVLLEAMAMGIPVVASRVGGIPDLLRHGRTGLLVKPNAPAQVSAGVLRLLQDGDLARRLGSAGQAQVERQCGPARAARRMASVYRAVLAERT